MAFIRTHITGLKLFMPDGAASWLLTECDPGLGFPELGFVSLTEITESRGKR
jgi:hypothetical protein